MYEPGTVSIRVMTGAKCLEPSFTQVVQRHVFSQKMSVAGEGVHIGRQKQTGDLATKAEVLRCMHHGGGG